MNGLCLLAVCTVNSRTPDASTKAPGTERMDIRAFTSWLLGYAAPSSLLLSSVKPVLRDANVQLSIKSLKAAIPNGQEVNAGVFAPSAPSPLMVPEDMALVFQEEISAAVAKRDAFV